MRKHLPPVAMLGLAFGLSALAIPFAESAPLLAAVLFGAGAALGAVAESWLVRAPRLFTAIERFQFGTPCARG